MFNSVSQTEFQELSQNEKPFFDLKILIDITYTLIQLIEFTSGSDTTVGKRESKTQRKIKILITFPKPDPCKSIN